MELHFTPEQEAQLAQIATKEGTDAERLVNDSPNAKDNFEFERRLEFRRKSGAY